MTGEEPVVSTLAALAALPVLSTLHPQLKALKIRAEDLRAREQRHSATYLETEAGDLEQ